MTTDQQRAGPRGMTGQFPSSGFGPTRARSGDRPASIKPDLLAPDIHVRFSNAPPDPQVSALRLVPESADVQEFADAEGGGDWLVGVPLRQVDNAGLDDVQAVEEAGDVLTAAQLAPA